MFRKIVSVKRKKKQNEYITLSYLIWFWNKKYNMNILNPDKEYNENRDDLYIKKIPRKKKII